MTLKEQALLKELPNNGYNISKTARKVGYKKSTSKGGKLYQQLRRTTNINELFTIEGIKRVQEEALKKYAHDNDNSNLQRGIEFSGKIAGVTDKSEVKSSIDITEKQEIGDYIRALATEKSIN